MIDTHTHLFSEKFASDREAAIDRALSVGVRQMYLPNIDVESFASMLSVEATYPGQCHAMLGLHPTSVAQDYQQQLDELAQHLESRHWSAIGEIGTDLYWSDEFWKEQQDAFRQQCGWAIRVDRPIVVHCRNSVAETIELVRPFVDQGLRGVFHCFSGSLAEAKLLTDWGFYLGIGGVLTYKKNGELPRIVKEVPLDKLVLETDSPYLAPVPKRGKRNESSYLVHVLTALAGYLGLPPAEVEALTDANAEQLFA